MTSDEGAGQEPREPRLLRRLRGSLRSADDAGAAPGRVRYARSLDGRHLWLALDGPATGLALRPDGPGRPVPIEDLCEVGTGGLVEACVSLDPLAGRSGGTDVSGLVLVDGAGPVRPAPGAVIGDAGSLTQAPVVDGRRLEVSAAGGAVRVDWQPVDARARVCRLAVDGELVRIFLDTDLAQPAEVKLRGPDGEQGPTVPVHQPADRSEPPSFELGADLAGLEPGIGYELHVGSPEGEAPLVRQRGSLRRPGPALAMPRVAGRQPSGPALLRLRFVRSGRLTAQLESSDASGGQR